jgi:CubicO group peptidase (beta-lactamase class C family)
VSVAVEKDGEVILARGYGLAEIELNVPVTVETVFRIGSISKQFAAVAILQLVEQGLVSLDDPITKFVPDYPTQGHEVTVHHLLTHTSGIVSYTGMGEAFWGKSRLDLSHEEMIDLFGNEPFDFAPGEKYKYNNSGFYLLGVIVEKVQPRIVASAAPLKGSTIGGSGPRPANSELNTELMYGAAPSFPRTAAARKAADKSFADYLETHLFGPIGMSSSSYCDDTAIVPHRAEGYEQQDGQLVNDQPLSMNLPGAAGALCSTVLDMLRWQRALDNNTLISAKSRAMMLTSATLNDGSQTGYAYGLRISEFEGHRKVSHGGGINGFNTQHATYPDDNLVVTVFANTNGANPAALEAQVTRLLMGTPLKN